MKELTLAANHAMYESRDRHRGACVELACALPFHSRKHGIKDPFFAEQSLHTKPELENVLRFSQQPRITTPNHFGQESDTHSPNLRPTLPTAKPTCQKRQFSQQPLEAFGIAG
ncbi:hypothetical protein M3J09_009989 [Ascochyta lentis]